MRKHQWVCDLWRGGANMSGARLPSREASNDPALKNKHDNKIAKIVNNDIVVKKLYRFSWADGCFFTMQVRTEDAGVGSQGLSGRFLRVDIASTEEFDEAYKGQYPDGDPKIGKWSVAVQIPVPIGGVSKAVWLDEWWAALRTNACSASGRMVGRYSIATATIFKHFIPDLVSAPAHQHAVCDPLILNVGDDYPQMDEVNDPPKAALSDYFIAQDPPNEIKDAVTQDSTKCSNACERKASRWDATPANYTRWQERRVEALTKLFYAGAWRLGYFEKMGGVFYNLKDPIVTRGNALVTPTFSDRLLATCHHEARNVVDEYKMHVNTSEKKEFITHDAGFLEWFGQKYCIKRAKQNDEGELTYSMHPLHLTKFDADVMRMSRVATAAQLTNWQMSLVKADEVPFPSAAKEDPKPDGAEGA